jgi:ABC-2 type transport system ATP-binding protein
MSNETLLELRDLAKRFGPITAVDGISFTVERGEVLGFLGPNGAGKSTTMKMIAGFLAPSAGTAIVAGHDVTTAPLAVQRCIGYLPEGAPLYGEMTPGGLLEFVATVRGLKGRKARERIGEVAERLQLASVYRRPIETLSKGFKRRVGLAQAILLDPEVLILDEPTDGLDPNQKHEVRKLLADMSGDKAIVISTHILEEVESVCSRAIVIGNGKVLADETPLSLQARSRYHNAVVLTVASDIAVSTRDLLADLAEVAAVEDKGAGNGKARLLALPDDGMDPLPAVRDALSKAGLVAEEVYQDRGRLEDVFRQLTIGG